MDLDTKKSAFLGKSDALLRIRRLFELLRDGFPFLIQTMQSFWMQRIL